MELFRLPRTLIEILRCPVKLFTLQSLARQRPPVIPEAADPFATD